MELLAHMKPMMKRGLVSLLILAPLLLGNIPAANAESGSRVVTLATLEWEPYIGPGLRDNGYVYQIVQEAFRRAGYSTDIAFLPWARAVSITEQGVRDALFPEYYDPGREEKYAFSDPFPGGPVGLYKRKDKNIAWVVDPTENQTEALRGLKDYRFGVVRGYINTTEFDAAEFLKKDAAVDDEMNLKKLYKDRVQLIFIDKFVATHIMVTRYPWYLGELEFMEPPLEVKDLFVAFSKQSENWEAKRDGFNRGLREIREDGTMDRIIEEFGF